MEPEVNGELAKLMVSLIGRRASRILAWFCIIIFVVWAVPFAIRQSGLEINQLAAGAGGLPSIADLAVVTLYMTISLVVVVFFTGLMWGLTDRITGHLFYRGEIAAIKAHLGMED